MRVAASLVALALALGTAQAKPPANLTREASSKLLGAYAACVADKHPELVRQYLFDREREQHREAYSLFADPDCVRSSGYDDFRKMRVAGFAITGAWAEQALRAHDTSPLEARFAALPPMALPRLRSVDEYRPGGSLSRQAFADEVAQQNGQRQLMMLAECVVRRNPAKSREAFATAVGSSDEAQALAALGSDLGACAPGVGLRLRPDQLRTALAIAHLRLAVAADPALKDRLFT